MNEELYSQTRKHNNQEFKRVAPGDIQVGQCVWITAYDPNAGRSWLDGPYFVVETVHKGRMSEHFEVFSTHLNEQRRVKHGDIWAPIIETIKPPRGHNA